MAMEQVRVLPGWDRAKQQHEPPTVSEQIGRESASASKSLGPETTAHQSTESHSRWFCFTARVWTDWWTWEILTISLSLAAFAALVMMLVIYNGKTTPQLPLGVTFNAIISTLATLTRSTVVLVVAASLSQYRWLWLHDTKHGCNLRDIQLVDDASRGPWGSIALLPHLRGRWLVALGAVTTVLSIALEPFVQQVPLFSLKPLHTPSRLANVPRAVTWGAQENEDLTGRWQYPVQAAVLRGLYYGQKSPLNPSCPAGNCTWPPFQSLSMCHKCIDVTDQVTFNGTCRFNAALAINITVPYTGGYAFENLQCDYKIKDKVIANGYINTGLEDGHEYDMQGMIISPSGQMNDSGSGQYYVQEIADLQLPGWRSPIFGFYRLMLNTTPADSGSPVIEALQCALNFCIQEHQLSLVGTSLSANSSTVALAIATTDHDKYFDNITWVSTTSGTDIDPKIHVQNDEAQWITDALATVITGSVNVSSTIGVYLYSSNAMYAMYLTNSFPDLLASVAGSLTQQILDVTQNFGVNAILPTAGYVDSLETILVVRWKWLSLPAAVLVSTAAFLVITMLETRRRHVKVWKSSSLPLLYHGLDQLDHRAIAIDRVSQMERDAQRQNVRLGQVTVSGQIVVWKILQRGRRIGAEKQP